MQNNSELESLRTEIDELRKLNDKMLKDLVDLETSNNNLEVELRATSLLLNYAAIRGKVPYDDRAKTAKTIFRLHCQLANEIDKTNFIGNVFYKDPATRADPIVKETHSDIVSFFKSIHGIEDDAIITLEKFDEGVGKVTLVGNSTIFDQSHLLTVYEAFREYGYEMTRVWDGLIGKHRYYFQPIVKEESSNGSDET